jgi:hypothetical protein
VKSHRDRCIGQTNSRDMDCEHGKSLKSKNHSQNK